MEKLLEHLIETKVLKSAAIIEALRQTDRKLFVPVNLAMDAYRDYPLSIGYGQTISQPTTVAFMLELLDVKTGNKILDVGSGSGWTTALLSRLTGSTGKVFGVEIIPELVIMGQTNLKKLNINNATIEQAGDALGLPSIAPFDRILVSAAAALLPDILVEQLQPDGTMVIPIQNAIWRLHRDAQGKIDTEKFVGFSFVPLIE